ncbi:MAG: fimbrial protein [Leclercia sp.]
MIKKAITAVFIATTVMASFSVMAADVGLLTFDGAVTDSTCKLTTSNGEDAYNVTITLPVVKKSEVESTSIDTGVGSKNFELLLTDCPESVVNASTTFMSNNMAAIANGTIEPDANMSGAASNVALALYNNTATSTDRIMIGQPASNTQKVALENGSGQLQYRVAYVPGSNWVATTNPVIAGKVTANAYFTLNYE